MIWNLAFTKQAEKDAKKIKGSKLQKKVMILLNLIQQSPYQDPPPYKHLQGDLKGSLSRRINHQHRLVYQVLSKNRIKVLRMWSHYE